MTPLHIRKHLDSHIIEIPELKELVGSTVEIIVLPQSGAGEQVPPGVGPRAGSAKGKIWMADDFDAPLDDFKEYME